MMCLGWNNRQTCKTRGEEVAMPSGTMCPDITWFWLAAAAILVGSVVQGNRGAKK